MCTIRVICKSMNFNYAVVIFVVVIQHGSFCMGVNTYDRDWTAGLRSLRPLYRIIYIGRRIGWITDRVNHYSSSHVKSIIRSCNVRYRQICIIQEDRIFRNCRLVGALLCVSNKCISTSKYYHADSDVFRSYHLN